MERSFFLPPIARGPFINEWNKTGMDPRWFNDCWIKVEMVKLSLTWLLDGFHKWADGSWLWELVGITRLCNPIFWVVREKRSEQTKKILDIYITWYNMGYGLKILTVGCHRPLMARALLKGSKRRKFAKPHWSEATSYIQTEYLRPGV